MAPHDATSPPSTRETAVGDIWFNTDLMTTGSPFAHHGSLRSSVTLVWMAIASECSTDATLDLSTAKAIEVADLIFDDPHQAEPILEALVADGLLEQLPDSYHLVPRPDLFRFLDPDTVR